MAQRDFDFESTWRAVHPDDIATLICTSGTTGDAKQVEVTHANLLCEVFGLDEVLGLRYGDRVTSFLPTAHIADRLNALYAQEVIGTQVTVVADMKTIATALPEVRPTFWGAMPLVWETLKTGIEAHAAAETGVKKALNNWALGAASTRARALLRGSEPGIADRVQYTVADILVLGKIRAAIGLDQARWLICGDAPIAKEALAYFAGLGLPITEAWGMTELCGIATVSHPRDAVLGRVGKPLPGLEARVAADGELLVRGPLVMKGYRNEPEKTAEAIDSDGWLHTGDIATVDDDGNVSIIDRKNELIVNAAGKTMSPSHIEHDEGRMRSDRGDDDSRRRSPIQHRTHRVQRGSRPRVRGPGRPRRRVSGDACDRPRPDRPDRYRRRAGQCAAFPRGADQAVHGVTGVLGARRGRNHAHYEAQTQTSHAEVRRRHRGTIRRGTRFNGARAQTPEPRGCRADFPGRCGSCWAAVSLVGVLG